MSVIFIFLCFLMFFIFLIMIRNEIVYNTGMRAIIEGHPDAYGGGKQYIKDMLDLRKWTYKQFYK